MLCLQHHHDENEHLEPARGKPALKGPECRIQWHLVVRLQIAAKWITLPFQARRRTYVGCKTHKKRERPSLERLIDWLICLFWATVETWWCNMAASVEENLLHGCIIRAGNGTTAKCCSQFFQVATVKKNPPAAQKAFSPLTTIVKETSAKLLTGHLELQTRSIMTFYYKFLIHGGFIFVKLSSRWEKWFKNRWRNNVTDHNVKSMGRGGTQGGEQQGKHYCTCSVGRISPEVNLETRNYS